MAKKKLKQDFESTRKKTGLEGDKEHVLEAHHQADKDIEQDPDLTSKPHREDDLDEGELAKLEGED